VSAQRAQLGGFPAPVLQKHDEVVTLFHELGHGIHDLVSRTIYSRFHGTSTVRDFVEAPSQMPRTVLVPWKRE
jgi:Zn-dependent oligopeptidase